MAFIRLTSTHITSSVHYSVLYNAQPAKT
uniref:Uncharacterized protein n=1 Tax=Arundo donax TaxID=35708 RepID=A0A0A9C9U2_ARUDO